MANASILKYTKVVKIDGLTKLQYDLEGFLVVFYLKGIKYVHTTKEQFRQDDIDTIYASGGYYQEVYFLKYLVKQDQISAFDIQNKYKLKDGDLPKAVTGDIIKVQKLKLVAPFTDFCKIQTFSWNYVDNSPILDNFFNIIIPPVTTLGYNVVEGNSPVGDIAREFYNRKINLLRSAFSCIIFHYG
jgi:hypothetical protein